MVTKEDCIGYDQGLCGAADDGVASVVLEGWSDVESINTTEVPGPAGGAFGMGDDSTAWGTHGCSVKVEWAVDAFPC